MRPDGSASLTIAVGLQNGFNNFNNAVALACSSPEFAGIRCSLSKSLGVAREQRYADGKHDWAVGGTGLDESWASRTLRLGSAVCWA